MVFYTLEKKAIQQFGGNKSDPTSMATVFLVSLLFLAIKSYLVQVTYNSVAPKLISNNGLSTQNFRPLDFWESVMLVILANNLFA
tara:strand:- start:73 stop:327 length:255 start_codon:yes stop_codon:yes gene_type:complete